MFEQATIKLFIKTFISCRHHQQAKQATFLSIHQPFSFHAHTKKTQ
jgi:hypothetical protein